jgi:4a-hydroxytetrahydrobiopterin dehydratase
MSELVQKKCIPCEGGVAPMTKKQAQEMLSQVAGWGLNETDNHLQIQKEFKFRDFKQAMTFVNQVAELAEQECHHPDIHIHYNKVELVLWTHAINGLSENDFIVAAKTNQLC